MRFTLFSSVGEAEATVLIAAALAKGGLLFENTAKEPGVNLANMLKTRWERKLKVQAQIPYGITGVDELSGGAIHTVIPG